MTTTTHISSDTTLTDVTGTAMGDVEASSRTRESRPADAVAWDHFVDFLGNDFRPGLAADGRSSLKGTGLAGQASLEGHGQGRRGHLPTAAEGRRALARGVDH